MAKLNKNLAQQAKDKASDWDGTGVVPPGVYLCKLTTVDTSRSGPSGPYWTWEYTTVGVADEPANKKFWDNTSLSDKAIGRLGKVFEAFGVDTDTDTDDLIGSLVAVTVKIGTIRAGERAGEQRNEVEALHQADVHAYHGDYTEAAQSAYAGSSADDLS
jgi:hypothetical protein